MSVKERLKEYLSEKSIKKSHFEKKIGVSNGYINSLKESPSAEKLELISNKFLDLNLTWLLTGEGSMLNSNNGISDSNSNVVIGSYNNVNKGKGLDKVTQVDDDRYVEIEFEDLSASAGLLGGGVLEELPEKKKRIVPKEYLKGISLVVKVHGNSMDDGTKRSLSDGEELLIHKFEDQLFNLPIRNKLFVIVTREGAVVKQIKKIDREKEEIICHSFNSEWEDYSVPLNEVLQIFVVERKVSSKIIF